MPKIGSKWPLPARERKSECVKESAAVKMSYFDRWFYNSHNRQPLGPPGRESGQEGEIVGRVGNARSSHLVAINGKAVKLLHSLNFPRSDWNWRGIATSRSTVGWYFISSHLPRKYTIYIKVQTFPTALCSRDQICLIIRKHILQSGVRSMPKTHPAPANCRFNTPKPDRGQTSDITHRRKS